jgi:hypothetical protein
MERTSRQKTSWMLKVQMGDDIDREGGILSKLNSSQYNRKVN